MADLSTSALTLAPRVRSPASGPKLDIATWPSHRRPQDLASTEARIFRPRHGIKYSHGISFRCAEREQLIDDSF